MEYIIYRMLRLIDREIEVYNRLYKCLQNQHKNILKGNVLNLIVDMVEQKEIIEITSGIEVDIKEEMLELAHKLNILSDNPNITMIVEELRETYPKMCSFFEERGKNLEMTIAKVDKINCENIALLKDYKTIWKDIVPLYNAWQDADACCCEEEFEEEMMEQPVFEINLN